MQFWLLLSHTLLLLAFRIGPASAANGKTYCIFGKEIRECDEDCCNDDDEGRVCKVVFKRSDGCPCKDALDNYGLAVRKAPELEGANVRVKSVTCAEEDTQANRTKRSHAPLAGSIDIWLFLKSRFGGGFIGKRDVDPSVEVELQPELTNLTLHTIFGEGKIHCLDDPCLAIGGECVLVSQGCMGGSFIEDKCAGLRDRKCCKTHEGLLEPEEEEVQA